jgi:hypothetical protein
MTRQTVKCTILSLIACTILFFTGFGIGSSVGNTTIINVPPTTEVPLPDGRTAKIAEGHDLDYTITHTPGQSYVYQEDERGAVGSSVKSYSTDAIPKIEAGEAPSITDEGIFGGKGFILTMVQVVKDGINVLYIIGGICIVCGGVVAWISKSWTPLLYIGGAGILVIAAAVFMQKYPWVILIAGIGALALIGWWFYRTYINKRTDTTLKAVVAGINTAEIKDPDATQKVLDEISAMNKNLNGTIRTTVDKIKAKLGITST